MTHHGYVILRDKRTADVIKVMGLKIERLTWIIGWVQSHRRDLLHLQADDGSEEEVKKFKMWEGLLALETKRVMS